MDYNDISDSSSDSESENEEIDEQNEAVDVDCPQLSLIDDQQTLLHIPDYEGEASRYEGEEAGETEDANRIATRLAAKASEQIGQKPDASPSDSDKQKRSKRKRKKLLFICLANCKYDSVHRASRRFGFKEVGEDEDWNLYWTDFSVSLERVMDMKRYQKINHFPGMSELCRKDLLARNLNRMLKLFPKEYNIFPRSWCLPADFGDFLAYTRQKKNKTYILKPESGCQGRGIWLTKSPKDIKPHEHMLCQQYLSKPFLIDGFKFDLRVYVVVTACDPLRIFVFQEGLGRFATAKYIAPSQSNVSNTFMHLTNYAINKNSNDFNRDDEAGSKRRITTINRWLKENGFDVDKLWREVDDIVIKTLISAHTVLKHNYRTCFPNHIRGSACFEVLGFDIVMDKKLRPFVLEVNHSPSFTTDAAIDREIKDVLLYDTLNLVNFGAVDRRRCIEEDRKKVKERLFSKQQDKKELKEDQDRAALKWQEEQTRYEDGHIGNFRRIYPAPGMEKYDKYFHSSGSLYQETAAFKARSECARQQREEISRKQEKMDSILRKKKDGTASGLIRPESPGGPPRPKVRGGKSAGDLLSSKSHTRTAADDANGGPLRSLYYVRYTVSLAQQHDRNKSSSSSLQSASVDSLQPDDILDTEETERLTALQQRDNLVRGLGLVDHITRLLRSVSSSDGAESGPGRPLVGAGDIGKTTGLTVESMILSSNPVATDGHYHHSVAANNRYSYNAHNFAAITSATEAMLQPWQPQQPQQQQAGLAYIQSPASSISSQRHQSTLNGPTSLAGGRVDTQWRHRVGSNSNGNASLQVGSIANERNNIVQHRTRYTSRNNATSTSATGTSDTSQQAAIDNGRIPASVKLLIGSTPPMQFGGNNPHDFSASSYAVLPHINRSNMLQPSAATAAHFGLSIISAPAPIVQRTELSTSGNVHRGGVAGRQLDGSCSGVGSGMRGHRGGIPYRAVRDSSGIVNL